MRYKSEFSLIGDFTIFAADWKLRVHANELVGTLWLCLSHVSKSEQEEETSFLAWKSLALKVEGVKRSHQNGDD